MNSIFCLLLSINQATLVLLFIADILMFVWFLEKRVKSVRKSRRCSGLSVNKFRKVFRILIKAKYACYKEIFHEILSSFAEQAVQKITFWIDLFPETYFLIYLNEQKNLNGSEWLKIYTCENYWNILMHFQEQNLTS